MEKEPFIFHSNSNHPSGIRVTVIGDYTNGVLNISVSRCSSKDAFVKKTGRKIAMDRFNEGDFTTSFASEEMSLARFIGAACAVGDAVIKHGANVKISLIENSTVFSEGFDGEYYPLGDPNEFSYVLN